MPCAYTHARAIKLKLTGEVELDIARVRAVRAARPDVWIGVDANQGYAHDTLLTLIPALVEARVSLLEQPCAAGPRVRTRRHPARRFRSQRTRACQGLDELDALVGRFDVVNIKLDKCGGLTEGLMMAERARVLGLRVMVGNMVGTSLAMAPAYMLGQQCDIVDLDGPTVPHPGSQSRRRFTPTAMCDAPMPSGVPRAHASEFNAAASANGLASHAG